MGTDLIQFNKKFKSLPDHNARQYEFHEDYDIGEIYPCSARLDEEAMRMVFEDKIAELIPPEYRGKVQFICKPVIPHDHLTPPFRSGWLYLGKKIYGKTQKETN